MPGINSADVVAQLKLVCCYSQYNRLSRLVVISSSKFINHCYIIFDSSLTIHRTFRHCIMRVFRFYSHTSLSKFSVVLFHKIPTISVENDSTRLGIVPFINCTIFTYVTIRLQTKKMLPESSIFCYHKMYRISNRGSV